MRAEFSRRRLEFAALAPRAEFRIGDLAAVAERIAKMHSGARQPVELVGEKNMAEISGGEIIARMLQKEGVEKVFGIIDGTYFGFYSALHRLGIEIVTPRHETCAAHMAGTYARLTGKLGVCMASNGPGVANLLPGLVVEQADGNRVLAITSARRPTIMYPDRGGSYQCFDQSGVIGKIGKWSAAVSSFDRVPELVRKALRKSWEGRPGVVHLDVPETIMNGKFKAEVVTGRRTSTATPCRQRRLLNR
jgi:acetolactate synthase-1/2/3 large subunit